MNIIMPTENEKNMSVEFILEQGLSEKTNRMKELRFIIEKIGFRNAFLGVGDAVALSILLSVFIFAVLLFSFVELNSATNNLDIYLIVGFFSPVAYFAMYFFILLKEKICDTYDLIMTCKYNIKHITSLRLIVISSITLGFVLILSIVLSNLSSPLYSDITFLTLFGFSMSAVLLYGILTLFSLLLPRLKWAQAAVPVLWMVCGGIVFVINEIIAPDLRIKSISTPIVLLVTLVLLSVYIFEFRLFLKRSTKGYSIHAFSK